MYPKTVASDQANEWARKEAENMLTGVIWPGPGSPRESPPMQVPNGIHTKDTLSTSVFWVQSSKCWSNGGNLLATLLGSQHSQSAEWNWFPRNLPWPLDTDHPNRPDGGLGSITRLSRFLRKYFLQNLEEAVHMPGAVLVLLGSCLGSNNGWWHLHTEILLHIHYSGHYLKKKKERK